MKTQNTKGAKRVVCGVLLCALLTGCSGKAIEDPVVSPIPESETESADINEIIASLEIPTPSPEDGNSLTPAAQELVARYEVFPFGSYPVTDETASMIRNSNLYNIGYLCEAPDGTIYYSVSTSTGGTIYHANADGSQRTTIADRRANNLQFNGDKLYFRDEDTCLIYTYDPQSQATVTVFDTRTGDAAVSGDCIYYCGTDGVYCYDQGNSTSKLLADTGALLPIWATMTEDILIYELVDEADPDFLTNALLFAYSFRDSKSYYLCPYAWMPVLAGSQIYYQNYKTTALESLDLNSGKITSFGFRTSRPSLNESTLYFAQWANERQQLMSCDLSTGEITHCLELDENVQSINYLYQTDRCVYIFTADSEVYYYDKTDGSSGRF